MPSSRVPAPRLRLVPQAVPTADADSGGDRNGRSGRLQAVQQRRQQRLRQYRRTLGWQAGVAVVVNGLWLSATAIALARLVPLWQTQHRNLNALEQAVGVMEERVEALRDKVELGLDPLQSEAAMREHLNYLPDRQMEILLVEPDSGDRPQI
ncbi:hypothetical protein [Synechococcus sp. PCC 7336]|uniref:hypothetical protein n=1 Tax=Synechococcus sp. PCC 7336 TaxID=195250 RepID=UPI0012EA39E3|nr:hypothetical protein [Synechococcus sp. PCC 7336]